MRYLTSRPFIAGLVLVVAAIASTPLFVTALGERDCTTPSAENPSWDCMQLFIVDYRIPALILVSGLALMLTTVVRVRRGGRR